MIESASSSAASRVTLAVSRDGLSGGIQLAVWDEGGIGYRIAGPKFSGSGATLIEHVLTEHDAAELRRYLDRAFPPQVTDPSIRPHLSSSSAQSDGGSE